MKKKRYIKPVVSVMEMETTAILAGSVIRKAGDEDYSDEKVKDFWDTLIPQHYSLTLFISA